MAAFSRKSIAGGSAQPAPGRRIGALKQIGDLHRLEHVGGVAIGAEADADAAAHHFKHGGAAHGIAHVGLGIVDHVRSAVAQQIDLAVIDMDAMRGESSAPRMPRSRHRSTTRIPCSRRQWSTSDSASAVCTWNPASKSAATWRQRASVLSLKVKEACRPKSPRSWLSGEFLVMLEKRAILLDSLRSNFGAVAIGDLVAKTAAQAGQQRGVGDAKQAARHSAGAGVMIEDCGHAIADAVDHAHHGAPIDVVEGERLVEPPPEALQNLSEVARRSIFERHAAREGAVEMGVGVDEPGQDDAAVRVEKSGVGMGMPQLGSRTNGGDQAIANGDAAVLK